MKKIFLLLLLCPLFTLASGPGKTLKLKGEVKTAKKLDWVYLNYRNADSNITDSVKADKGEFKFELNLEEPVFATLSFKFEKTDETAKPDIERMRVFLEPGKIDIDIKDSVKAATVEGSKAHSAYEALGKLLKPYDDQMSELNDQYRQFYNDKNEEGMKGLQAKAGKISDEKNEKVYRVYLKDNPGSPVALYVLNTYAGYDMDPAMVEPLYQSLPASTRQLPSGIAFKEKIETAKKTAVGVMAMDFTQNDTLGLPVSLSSLKGKYVLVDFWASWCGPCRAENPNLVKAFDKYNNKNFTVLGVSLDQPGKQKAWMDAIHKDGLWWTQVSDLKFWDNAVAKQYGIRAIPQNFLLDPSGKIIDKNIKGEELNTKLKELLPE